MVFFYISKAPCLHDPTPTLDLPWCVSVCVSVPGKPSIDTQLSTVLIHTLRGESPTCITEYSQKETSMDARKH